MWLSALLIAAVSNLDNLAVGTALGMRAMRIGAGANLIIAAVTMAATAGAMTSGRVLSELLPASVAAGIGASIIIGIGVWTIVTSLRSFRAPGAPLVHTMNPGEAISAREALGLGIALSLNNVGSGVGAGAARVPLIITTMLTGMFSLLCVGGGSRSGQALGRRVLGGRAPFIAGLVLVGVGSAMLPAAV